MPIQVQNPRNVFYTCRYWALGPQCPNVDAFGTVICEFAHYDTGRLASHFQQRGTCLAWKHFGFCGRGAGCWYEHRDTGVTGLYQGTVELTGFELDVADAATKAGFNTFSHEALFNLVWTVKRLALRARGSQFRTRPPPPKDPIYPDRYRPSGIGDNTKKKSRAVTVQPPPNHTVELKFHPIQPLMRKRPLNDVKEENVIDLTASSDNEDLIDLTNSPYSTSKRQKVAATVNTPKEPHFDLSTPKTVHSRNIATTLVGPTTKGLSKGQRKRANKKARAALSGNRVQVVSKLPLTAANAVPIVPRKPLTAEEEITKQLLLVKTKLDDARKNMNTCQATMKSLFDVHYGKFDNDETMMALQKLSNHMNKVYDSGKDGAGEIDRAVALLNEKDGILCPRLSKQTE